MKNILITPAQITEIESLIPEHSDALIAYGAQMHFEGICRGFVITSCGIIAGVILKICADEVRDKLKKK